MIQDSEAVKTCCANVYEHPLVQQLLGDSFHPGGTVLTERVGNMVGLTSSSRVLDVASGKGTSALHLAKVFGCEVVGVDLGPKNVEIASQSAKEAGLTRASFQVMDAEQLSFEEGTFDVVLCECALCTFPDKPRALKGFYDVLKTGGVVAISDLTRDGLLVPELEGLLAWVACIADALPVDTYLRLLSESGFQTGSRHHNCDECLTDMVKRIQANLLGAKVLVGLGKLDLPAGVDLQNAMAVARAARDAIESGILGYSVFIGRKIEAITPD